MSARPKENPEDVVPVYSSPQWVGKQLREVGRDYLSADSQTVTSRWFHSAQESDLFIWVDESDRLIKGQLTFCGAVVEWNVMEGLKTGLIVEEEHQDLKSSEIIQFDRVPDGRHVHFAALVIENVPGLEDEVKGVFTRLLRSQSRNYTLGRILKSNESPFGKKNLSESQAIPYEFPVVGRSFGLSQLLRRFRAKIKSWFS